jgi:hypothetical protein
MVLRLIRLRMASWDTRSWAAACATVRRSRAKSYTRPVRFSLFLVSHLPNLASRRAAPRYVLKGNRGAEERDRPHGLSFLRDTVRKVIRVTLQARIWPEYGVRNGPNRAFRRSVGLRRGCVRGFPDSFRNEVLGSSPRKPQEMGHRAYMRGPSGALSYACLYQARGGGGPHTQTPALFHLTSCRKLPEKSRWVPNQSPTSR